MQPADSQSKSITVKMENGQYVVTCEAPTNNDQGYPTEMKTYTYSDKDEFFNALDDLLSGPEPDSPPEDMMAPDKSSDA